MEDRHKSAFENIKTSLSNTEDAPIVVVGAGPGGAIAALEAIAKGHKVVVVTKYPYVTRTQRIKISNKNIKILQKYRIADDEEDKKFFEKLSSNSGTASIGGIERYLKRKLEAAASASNGDVHLIDDTQGELTAVNTTDKTVTLTQFNKRNGKDKHKVDDVTFNFRHLVDASGTKRAAYHLAWRGKIDKPIGQQAHHLAQGTTVFKVTQPESYGKMQNIINKIKDLILPGVIHKVRFSKADVGYLRNTFGWDKNYKPTVYIIANKKGDKFYVGGEIPDVILSIQDADERRQKIIAWNQYALETRFRNKNVGDINIYVKENESLHDLSGNADTNRHDEVEAEAAFKKIENRVTGFNMLLSRVKKAINNISTVKDEPVMVVAVGDALQSADFHQAHGINDAIFLGHEFGHALPHHDDKKNKFNIVKYSSAVNSVMETHDKRVQRRDKRYEKKSAGFLRTLSSYLPFSSLRKRGDESRSVSAPAYLHFGLFNQEKDVPKTVRDIAIQTEADADFQWVKGKKDNLVIDSDAGKNDSNYHQTQKQEGEGKEEREEEKEKEKEQEEKWVGYHPKSK